MSYVISIFSAIAVSVCGIFVWAILDDDRHPEGDTRWVVYPYLDKKGR